MRSRLTRWANRFARKSPTFIAVLAVVGLALSIVILFLSAVGANLAARANVSTAVATMFALFAAIAAVSAVVWIESSDYKAEQAVKADTARLRATLRSIMVKGALLSQQRGHATCLDFKTEREFLNQFLTSTTGFGYWSWVEERGKAAGDEDEPWRVFFLYIAHLLNAPDPVANGEMISWAVKVEKQLEKLERGHIDRISSSVADLAGVLGKAAQSEDPLLSGVAAVYDS